VIAVPNRDFPPDPVALDLADLMLDSLLELNAEVVRRVGSFSAEAGR
jgi:hypothetical protein